MDDLFEAPGRKRKGSLRKTVLLGVERLHRRTSGASTNDPKKSPTKPSSSKQQKPASRFAFELPNANSSTESHGPPAAQLSRQTTLESEISTTSLLASPTATSTYASTSEDDGLNIPTTSLNNALLQPPFPRTTSLSPSPPSSESSIPATTSTPSRRLSTKSNAKSPLAFPVAQPTVLAPIQEEWDYSDTEWWGWVILIVTWIVFVVGMGSCFGVWSWAWDVGETPYAPPELEDDPTLPIVGYYPALFVLTAFMSWVWVTVAWVGLKYFKHAKMQ